MIGRRTPPGAGADKLLTVVIEFVAPAVCLQAWSEACGSAARDKESARLRATTAKKARGRSTKKRDNR